MLRSGTEEVGNLSEKQLLVSDGQRTATAVSQSQVTLLRISYADFDLLFTLARSCFRDAAGS
jgi:hypothetical protein